MGALEIFAITGIGEIGLGDDLGAVIVDAAAASGRPIEGDDVVIVTQKIVSKAEGQIVPCANDEERLRISLSEAERVLRRRGSLVITETRHGFVCANSGVDASNVASGTAALLPIDPDESARRIQESIRSHGRCETAVIISDTFGRPWRNGVMDVAIGLVGILPILDLRGTSDASGRDLVATEIAVADELAAAGELVMGKSSGCPVAVIRGYDGPRGEGRATDLVRPAAEDLFR